MIGYIRPVSPLVLTLVVGLTTLFGTVFTKLYRARMLMRDLQRRGLPVAPNHSFLFGHLLYLKSYLDRHPSDAHYQYAFAAIARDEFQDTGAFYIDLWPMGGSFLVVVSPKMGVEITQTNPALACARPKELRQFFKPITGGPTIFDLDEKDWKAWRVAFNKGFQGDHIMSLVAGMVQEIQVYAETLRGFADRKELCFLDPITLRFMIDVIGKTNLNANLNAQKGYNVLADSMLTQIRWHNPNAEIYTPLSPMKLVRMFVHWINGRRMDQYIGAELDKRYEEYRSDSHSIASKSVMDLTLQAYMSDFTELMKSDTLPETLTTRFRSFAISQMRLFIFTGYDSTASTICYCFYLLSKNPDALARLRAEHDQVLGPDPAAAGVVLSKNPYLVNSLHYTLAVIKEVLRLFAPAGTTRAGKHNVNVTDDAGHQCPTENVMLWILHVEMHRAGKYWVRPDEFLPERWMVPPGHKLYPQPGAWRPFELGPRNCIAQAMVLVELRVVLACMARSFDIKPAYDEWDAKHPRKGEQLYRGERAYQVEAGASHPAAQFPCRIYVR